MQTSCGFAVPLFDYSGERDIHCEWVEKKVDYGLREYMKEKNLTSQDGLPTDIGLRWERDSS